MKLKTKRCFLEKLKHPQIREIRGKGLMLAAIVKNEEMVDKIIEKCIKKEFSYFDCYGKKL